MAELSVEAKFWLEYFVKHPEVRITQDILTSSGVSHRRSTLILNELKAQELVKLVRYVGGGSILKLTTTEAYTVSSSETYTVSTSETDTVSTSGIASTAVQLVSSIYNSYTASTAVKATNKFLGGAEGEDKSVGYDFFESTSSSEDDDLIAARKKHQAQKTAEYQEAREQKAAVRKDLHRSKQDPSNWTSKDVAYEFSDRLRDLWSIKPFSVTQSKFIGALATFRKQHSTDGAIEMELLNLFFSSVKSDKYTDGNHLWRAFLYKAPQLLQTARERVVSVEQSANDVLRDAELASKKLSIFDEDDDV